MVSGEAIKPAHADDRPVDAPATILVTPMTGATVVTRPAPTPRATVRPTPAAGPAKRGGAWLVVLVYLLSAAALGYEIWDRFLRG